MKVFKEFVNEAEETKAPAPAPAEQEASVDSPEIALDPRLEKEIFIDTFEVIFVFLTKTSKFKSKSCPRRRPRWKQGPSKDLGQFTWACMYWELYQTLKGL